MCTYSCGAVFLGNIRTSLLKYHVSVTPEFDTPSVRTTEIVDMECEKVDLCKEIKRLWNNKFSWTYYHVRDTRECVDLILRREI